MTVNDRYWRKADIPLGEPDVLVPARLRRPLPTQSGHSASSSKRGFWGWHFGDMLKS